MTADTPHILLINPWIHDFAAYDFWAKPLGLLSLAAVLRNAGVRVSYIDCLDRFHPNAVPTDIRARNGRGPYLKTPLPKPPVLKDVPRNFSRYGIKKEWLHQDLAAISVPDAILVTSLMTYWCTGVAETIAVVRKHFPKTPVIVGGVYATLCREHAEKSLGADMVVAGPGESQLEEIVARTTGYRIQTGFDGNDFSSHPYPAFDLQRQIGYVTLLTTKGCPFSCAYCASSFLHKTFVRKTPEKVVEEVNHWHRKHGVSDFAFYDDALLVNREKHALPLLEGFVRAGLKVRFHTPNALHIRKISQEAASLMHRAGFHTLRLGLETAAFDDRCDLDEKVTAREFRLAVERLKQAGFDREQVGAYLLAGLPGQSETALRRSIQTVIESGVTPILAYYTPIPHTRMWPQAVAASRYDLTAEPLCCNNAVFPCRPDGFSWETITGYKKLMKTAEPKNKEPLNFEGRHSTHLK